MPLRNAYLDWNFTKSRWKCSHTTLKTQIHLRNACPGCRRRNDRFCSCLAKRVNELPNSQWHVNKQNKTFISYLPFVRQLAQERRITDSCSFPSAWIILTVWFFWLSFNSSFTFCTVKIRCASYLLLHGLRSMSSLQDVYLQRVKIVPTATDCTRLCKTMSHVNKACLFGD